MSFLFPNKRKDVNSTGYVILSRLNAIERREQVTQWEDIKIDGNGNTILRSVRSNIPDGQCFSVERSIQIPKDDVGGPFMVVKPRSVVAKDEEKDTIGGFVVL